MPSGSAKVCKEILDDGARSKMMIECLGYEVLTDANELTEDELDSVKVFFLKTAIKAEKLMDSFQK